MHEQLVEDRVGLDRIHHVGRLVDAKLLRDDLELFLQHLAHAVFHGVFEHEVDGANHVLLSNAVHLANALLDPHRVPRHVEVDDDMAELQVQAFATGIGGNQHAHILENACCARVRASRSMLPLSVVTEKPRLLQVIGQHRLRGHELGEDQHLQRRVTFSCCSL